MKQGSSWFLAAALLCTLLAGCSEKMPHLSATEGGVDAISPEEDTVMRCRVVAVDGENQLLLADVDGDHPDIYTLDASSVPLYRKETEGGTLLADGQLSAGAMIRVAFSGGIMETYPAQFGEVTGITFLPDEFDDRCGLYLRVLGDLWEKDEGLNHAAEYISVDLTATSLTPAERSAVAWSFARSHKAEPMELSYEQLCQEGYISGLDEEDDFPAWEDGILFTIAETDDPEGEAEPPLGQDKGKDTVSFHADKWRSALGAYGLSQCVAVQNDDGLWGEYTVNGGAWIS